MVFANAICWVSAHTQGEIKTTQIAAVVAILLALTTITSHFFTWYRLRHVPGPFFNSLTFLVQLKKQTEGQFHLYLEELHQKYGPLVRISPTEVMFSDPDTLRRVAGIRSQYTRGPFFEVMRAQPGKDHVFSTRDEQRHRELKAKMGPGYAGQENGGFERSLDKIIHQLIDLIERKYISTETDYRPNDFSNTASYFTLDVISEISYREPFGFLKNDKDMFGYNEQFHKALPVMMIFSTWPGLSKWLNMWPMSLLMPCEKDKFGLGYMVGFATKFVDTRLSQKEPGHDIIQSFINHGLPRDQLIQEITLQILAGSDTSATTIRMTILHLICNPASLRRLLAEIDDALTGEKLSQTTKDGGIITNAEAPTLPYLQAVIREGLRIFPLTGLVGKLVPSPGGDTVHGYKLPQGTIMGQNLWGICRSKKTFGDDADMFRPERWLLGEDTESQAKLREMVGVQELAFGYGKWQCLGKGLVGIELGKVLFELFRRYDFAIVNPVHPMSLKTASVALSKDFWLMITKRGRE